MFKLKSLNREETIKLLKMDQVIDVVETVYKMKAEGDTEIFPMVFHEFQPGVADFDIKSGWLKPDNIFGLKVVSWFGENPKKDLPTLIGTIMVLDSRTGAPIGLMDGAHITGMRTGAAGAVGAKYLARPDSKSLLIVGAGHIAMFQIAATLVLFPGLKDIYIYDGLNCEGARVMKESLAGRLEQEFGLTISKDLRLHAVSDIKAATGESDIIITCTPSRKPIIMKDWVRPGTHFSCIGSDMPMKEEIDPEIFREARVFADDVEQCVNVGEIEIPISTGVMKREDIAGEIGEVIAGKTVGRQNDEQITVFDATGIGLLDILTGKLALDLAEKQQVGTTINL